MTSLLKLHLVMIAVVDWRVVDWRVAVTLITRSGKPCCLCIMLEQELMSLAICPSCFILYNVCTKVFAFPRNYGDSDTDADLDMPSCEPSCRK